MHGAIGERNLMRPRQMLLDFSVTATAAHGRELLLEFGEDPRGHRRQFARRFFDRYQRPEPPSS
jgi:hypothetical protein